MRTLVTGSGGFIGINMCLKLINNGHEVVAIYRTDIPKRIREVFEAYGNRVTLLKGDLMDSEVLEDIKRTDIDSIVHCAVITSPNKNETELLPIMARVNMQTTVNLLEYCINNYIKNFVYVSSSGVYGSMCEINKTVKEDDELNLFNTYCITKRTCELLVDRYGKLTGSKAVSGRIAAPYGPYERVTPSRAAMSPIYKMVYYAINHKPVKIYGEDVVRDWTYVEDTVSALYELLITKKLNYSEYNVSCSVSYSLGDIARAVAKVEPSFKYEFVSNPEEADIAMFPNQQRGALDIIRITNDTYYTPDYSLEEGIRKYVEWARDNFIE